MITGSSADFGGHPSKDVGEFEKWHHEGPRGAACSFRDSAHSQPKRLANSSGVCLGLTLAGSLPTGIGSPDY